MRQIIGVEEAAELCQVSVREVKRWFDAGRLSGYRVGIVRRIPVEALQQFMESRGTPIPDDILWPVVCPLVRAVESLLPFLTTEEEALNYASMNDGRCAPFDSASLAVRRALEAERGADLCRT
jgi:excisionase family DNA binding protein